MECLFCKIINKEINSDVIYEDEKILAFMDIDKKAPVHFLVIPKIHISSTNDLSMENIDYISHIFLKIKDIAKELNLKNGYRIVNNCGKDAGQTVFHIHFHVLGERNLLWPPG